VFVGAFKIELRILESRSLKEKRMTLRRMKDRARERLGVTVVEVGAQDLWQRAEVGVATVSGDRGKLIALLDEVRRCIVATEGVEVLQEWRDVSTFDGRSVEGAAIVAGDDAAWVPSEWRELLERDAEGSASGAGGQQAAGIAELAPSPRDAR
jgi:uncharacterized protein